MSDSDDDLLAAEFVLGTLGPEEFAAAEQRLKDDAGLRQAVLAWEDRFSPLVGLYADVAPREDLLPALLAKLDARPRLVADRQVPDVLILRKSVQRWRLATAAAMALAACLVGWIVIAPGQNLNQGGRFVAVLQKDANSPAILLAVDIAARRAEIRQVSSEQPVDKSYELWLINPEVGAPRSLGVLRPKGVTDASLAPFDAAVIARATYAITVEQPGGSPSGAPSGPPVLSGKLVGEDP